MQENVNCLYVDKNQKKEGKINVIKWALDN